ncbi:MAG TPA: hypothetical protein VNT22_10460 [Baekduia sp.]|nr:hypothetical protein [Baekduia sp.]
MPLCAELVTIKVDASPEEFLPVREAAIHQVKERHPGLIDVPVITKREDGTWFEVWIYESKEAAQAAADDIPNMPKFLEFAAFVTEPAQIEFTDMPDGGSSPL